MSRSRGIFPQVLRATLIGCAASVIAYAAVGADTAQRISGLQAHPDLPLPSALRVVTAVAMTLALAAGSLVLLKRLLPKYAGRMAHTDSAIKVLARSRISSSLQAHVIEVDTSRILIVEGRGGIELAVLPPASRGELQTRT